MDEVEQEMDAPHFKDAVARYKSEAGKLFQQPSKKHSDFERNAWLLRDIDGGLLAIVNDAGVLFGKNIMAFMIQAGQKF